MSQSDEEYARREREREARIRWEKDRRRRCAAYILLRREQEERQARKAMRKAEYLAWLAKQRTYAEAREVSTLRAVETSVVVRSILEGASHDGLVLTPEQWTGVHEALHRVHFDALDPQGPGVDELKRNMLFARFTLDTLTKELADVGLPLSAQIDIVARAAEAAGFDFRLPGAGLNGLAALNAAAELPDPNLPRIGALSLCMRGLEFVPDPGHGRWTRFGLTPDEVARVIDLDVFRARPPTAARFAAWSAADRGGDGIWR